MHTHVRTQKSSTNIIANHVYYGCYFLLSVLAFHLYLASKVREDQVRNVQKSDDIHQISHTPDGKNSVRSPILCTLIRFRLFAICCCWMNCSCSWQQFNRTNQTQCDRTKTHTRKKIVYLVFNSIFVVIVAASLFFFLSHRRSFINHVFFNTPLTVFFLYPSSAYRFFLFISISFPLLIFFTFIENTTLCFGCAVAYTYTKALIVQHIFSCCCCCCCFVTQIKLWM